VNIPNQIRGDTSPSQIILDDFGIDNRLEDINIRAGQFNGCDD
jgi:hypothetical protein